MSKKKRAKRQTGKATSLPGRKSGEAASLSGRQAGLGEGSPGCKSGKVSAFSGRQKRARPSGMNALRPQTGEASALSGRQAGLSEAATVRQARQRRWRWGGALAAIMLLVALTVVLVQEYRAAHTEVAGQSSASVSAAGTSVTKAGSEQEAEAPGADTISFGKELVAGSSNPGKPQVDIYFDLLCMHCNALEAQWGQQLESLLKAGEVTVVYHPISLGQSAYATQGGAQLLWAARHLPQQAWAVKRAVFEPGRQMYLLNSRQQLPDANEQQQLLQKAGLTAAQAQAVWQGGKQFEATITRASQAAFAQGVHATPTVLVNGEPVEWTQGFLPALEKQGDKGLRQRLEQQGLPLDPQPVG